MQNNLDLLGKRNLRHICIPGSHDAGMSVRNGGTAFACDCNTLTQTSGILGQLQLGMRYFDIRPVIGGKSGEYFAGHYTHIGLINSWQGANGQSIRSIIDDVNTYTACYKELVILYLSHDLNTNVGNSKYRYFTQEEWNGLFAQMKALNHLFIADNPANVDLTMLTLNDFISNNRAAVIVVVDPENKNISLGDYASQGFYMAKNFLVYNNYSDTNDLNKMARCQIKKMKKQKQKPDAPYFLLSWTLTQSNCQAVFCFTGLKKSIRRLADTAPATE